jgi:lipopolysaccharide cholinephosphotransferase
LRYICFIISRGVNRDELANEILDFYKTIPENRNSINRYYANAVANIYGVKEIMPYEVFKEVEEIEFCGKKYLALKEYDYYLRHIYGDYMQLPPENERVPHHYDNVYYK